MALRSSLWMGDLEMYMNESFITNAFHQAGENITGVKIMKNRSNGSPLGYGFIEFPDHDAAQRCMSKLNGKVIPGTTPPKRFRLNPVHGKEHGIVSEYSLFVGDLTNDVDEYSLYRAFAKRYKSCFAAKIVVDNTGVSKGFGFVRFFDEGDQQKALIEMQHMTKVGQRPLRVGLPKSKGASEVSEPYQYYPSYGVPYSKAYTWGGFTHYYHDYYNNANSTTNAFQNYPQTQNYYEQDGDDMEALEDPCLEVDVDSLNKEYMEQSEEFYCALEDSRWHPLDTVTSTIKNTS